MHIPLAAVQKEGDNPIGEREPPFPGAALERHSPAVIIEWVKPQHQARAKPGTQIRQGKARAQRISLARDK